MLNQDYRASLVISDEPDLLDPSTLKLPNRNKAFDLPPLNVLLDDLQPFPPNSGFMGVSEDGVPIIFNMNKNKSGCKLLISDRQTSLTRYLDMFIESIRFLNRGSNIRIDRLSGSSILHQPSMTKIESHHWDKPFMEIETGSSYNPGSFSGHSTGKPIKVLVIENLEPFLSSLTIDSYGRFLKLVQEGPHNNLWIIAGINLHSTVSLDDLLVQSFPVKVFGPIHSPEYINYFTRTPASRIRSLVGGRQYVLDSQRNWHTFWIPSQ